MSNREETAIEALVQRLLDGDRRALARVLTIVESGPRADRGRVMSLLPVAEARARTLGITGPPGVGKSTLTSALASGLRAHGRGVAILSIDPSSPFSGGALLGDRVRMGVHHSDTGVYIRSMASRGQLGGLSLAAPQAIAVLEAAGFDDIVVETVGVGQSEVRIAQTAETTILVLAPGLGDHVQIAKAGVLEIADILVVNKSDDPGAQKMAAELRGMVGRGGQTAAADHESHWSPPIVPTVAVRGNGIEALVEAIDVHAEYAARRYPLGAQKREQAMLTILELAVEKTRNRLSAMVGKANSPLHQMAEQVLARRVDVERAADVVLTVDSAARVEF